ncbi:uncharacterized protein EDB93DRAFT_1108333 [Suillus bovinus]|uniref:uncharacterized protein n=1 Tax=Suillus bovinus TaxID=48563 RepID=UPI001B879161|nr:uncharacterized protein EDB93DRAFT_1108333 [Suillus bovinus]KAG2130665.1 hypothetical protein EDB93DRAFT_1108333 [Suillus bovinus]
MAPSTITAFLKPIFLLTSIILPYLILLLPSVLKLQFHANLMFSFTVLGVTTLIANLYYLFSLVPSLGLDHELGCIAQLFNWVVNLTYLMSTTMPGIQIFSFPIMTALLIILFPAMELLFWAFVGSGRERVHLNAYGEIHDWIILRWGNLLMDCFDCCFDCMKWVAIRDYFPCNPPNQQLEDIGIPPYSSNVFTRHSVSSNSSDVTMTDAQ